ncbi:MAG: hypothetical protein ABW168_14185 [Sedimenticola sp.]
MRRKVFLREFLGALGAVEIQWHEETDDKISGAVIYEVNDPEEKQDFVWHKSEKDMPDQDVFNLVKLIHKDKLLSIDQIKVTRLELNSKFNKAYDCTKTEQEFSNILESLETIEVPMLDAGREIDAYFIHE